MNPTQFEVNTCVKPNNQQIIISGVGGQGVLFVTRLLAEAAINKGLAVFTSETHGMAQRGRDGAVAFKGGRFLESLDSSRSGGWAAGFEGRKFGPARGLFKR